MKKLLIAAAVFIPLLYSCGDDNDENPKPAVTAATVKGDWNLTLFARKILDANNTQIGKTDSLTFAKGVFLVSFTDNAYSEKYNNQTSNGTYTHNQNNLTLVSANSIILKPGSYTVDSLTVNRVVIRDTIIENNVKVINIVTFRK